MFENDNISIAESYFSKAYNLHVRGDIQEAIDTFKLSIKFNPTSKAHNCLGRIYGLQRRYEAAIDQSILAAMLEPDHGNHYNDIGIYLLNLNRFDQAVIWFDKALNAAIYDFKHYPLFNLGTIAEIKGQWQEAISCYDEALVLCPTYKVAQIALTRVYSYLN